MLYVSPGLFLVRCHRKVVFDSTGGIYIHTVAKVIFVRLFRHSQHVHSHTVLGWTVWTLLCIVGVVIGVALAIAVPIFSYLIGIAAALFAAWYTYGLAGFFWLFDTYHLKGGMDAIRQRRVGTVLAVMTILAGAFVCVAGTYVFVKESGLWVVDLVTGPDVLIAHLPVLRGWHDWQAIRLLNWDPLTRDLSSR